MTPITLTLVVDQDNAQIVAKFLLDLFPPEPKAAPAPVAEPEPPKPESKPKQTKATEPKTKPEPEPKPTAEPAPEQDAPRSPQISLSDVRAKALVLSKAGRQETLKELFARHGGSKLSEIDTSKYEALLADMEAAINGQS